MLQHEFDDVFEVQVSRLLTDDIELGHKAGDHGARAAGQRADCVVQRASGGAGQVLQLFDAARTDSARREVHHPQEAGVVVGVLQKAQVRQRVLDFSALKKAQAAIHTVGNAGIEQAGFNHPALRIAAVEHGNF